MDGIVKVLMALIGAWLLAGCDGGGAETHPGETVYNRSCFSCHASGAGGAPVTGDREAWAPRVAKGDAALLKSVKEGIAPGMPAMGMCVACSDADLAAAIDFMVQASN